MRLGVLLSATFLVIAIPATTTAGTFPDSHDQLPAGWTGAVFRLSQQFPATDPSRATPPPTYPWQQIDFHNKPAEYIKAVFDYVQEGNREVDWAVQNNAVRPWYHAPWMHYGDKGREFVRGLTRERFTPTPRPGETGELGPQQTACAQNWAVGFLNAPGGYVLGQVWAVPDAPDPLKALFPEGTVAAKLLFTAASLDQVPYLNGTLEWDANIDTLPAGDTRCTNSSGRSIQKVRVLQMDLARQETVSIKARSAPITICRYPTASRISSCGSRRRTASWHRRRGHRPALGRSPCPHRALQFRQRMTGKSSSSTASGSTGSNASVRTDRPPMRPISGPAVCRGCGVSHGLDLVPVPL